MAIYSSLKALISKNPKRTRHFFTATAASLIPGSPYSPLFFPSFSHPLSHPHSSRFFSPLSKWIIPFQGPLFLSSPPWKLSQSATPLYCRGNAAVFRKVEALNLKLNLDLIGSRARFPVRLGLESVSYDPRAVLDKLEPEREIAKRNGFVQSFVNLPNLISISRLISGPFLGWMIINEMYSSAFVGLAISGATDWLDGYVARKMRINSVVGSYLDPLADKVLIGFVALAMVHQDLLHPGLVGLVVSRDVALVGGAIYQRAVSLQWEWRRWSDFFNFDGMHPQKVEPLFLSKVNTVFQLVLVAAALLQPEFGNQETQSWITYLSWVVASTTVASTAAYGAQHISKRSTLITRKS